MAQDDDRTVVLVHPVVIECRDLAVERREDRRARVGKEVETDVYRPVFVGESWAECERRRDIEQARLVVSSDRHAHAGVAHDLLDADA